MTSPLRTLSNVLQGTVTKVRASTWRKQTEEELEDILLDLARGRAWIPTLPNGEVAAPVIPSSDVRLRAALSLKELLGGKAVPQTEIAKAELEQLEREAVRSLSDEELEKRAAQILASRGSKVLNPGPTTDAEVVSEPVDIAQAAQQIWDAPQVPEE